MELRSYARAAEATKVGVANSLYNHDIGHTSLRPWLEMVVSAVITGDGVSIFLLSSRQACDA